MIPGNFLQDNCWMGSDCPYHSNIQQLKSQLRTLAQAVLDAHTDSCEKCPENIDRGCSGQDVGYNVNCCQCEACTIAREVLK